jgi:catechol 2,3-dioxygenase-like lactoylglutathione lyase family enzyme
MVARLFKLPLPKLGLAIAITSCFKAVKRTHVSIASTKVWDSNREVRVSYVARRPTQPNAAACWLLAHRRCEIPVLQVSTLRAFSIAKRGMIHHPYRMIEGLSHITLIVSDLAKTKALIETVFQGREVYSSDGQQFSLSSEKFFLVGGLWIAIMEGRSLAEKTYNHIAFKVAEGDLQKLKDRAVSLGLEVRESRPRVEGEGSSVNFCDYDNHLFEFHTGTLESRLARYAKGNLALGGKHSGGKVA